MLVLHDQTGSTVMSTKYSDYDLQPVNFCYYWQHAFMDNSHDSVLDTDSVRVNHHMIH